MIMPSVVHNKGHHHDNAWPHRMVNEPTNDHSNRKTIEPHGVDKPQLLGAQAKLLT